MNEQRYQKPDIVNDIAMIIDGDNGVRYYLCFNEEEATVMALFDGVNVFMASLEYAASNGLLHAMTDNRMIDHKMDYDAWKSFRRYVGDYSDPAPNKYKAWLES